MAPKGNKRKCPELPATFLVDAHAGIRNMVNVFDAAGNVGGAYGASSEWARKAASKELYKIAKHETPFGSVCESSIVAGKTGPLQIHHLNPFAFFYHAMSISESFARLMLQCQSEAPDGMMQLCIYLDKAVPGNPNRPDDGRACQCIYFSILELPDWFRSRRNGWIPFSYILYADQKRCGLSDTMLLRFVVRTFHDPSKLENLETGIPVPTSFGTVLVRATCKLTIAYWEENIHMYHLVGYNGSVPCGLCRNVLGRCPWFEHERLVHIHSPEHHRFELHTPTTIRELLVHLEHVAKHGTATELAKLQQSTGFKYDCDGVLYDPEVVSRMEPPMCEFGDWMHGYVASGGIAQYELNQIVRVIVAENVALEEIDSWITQIQLPRGMCKLKRCFFATRIVDRPDAHIKAFAAEVLTAVTLLGFFLDAIVAPMKLAILQPYIDCFVMLRIIFTILQRADIQDLELLKDATQTHHSLYMELYPLCLKPKLHAVAHIYDFWKRWHRLLSCFAPERHHRCMKKTMSFSYNRSQMTTLAYDVRSWFKSLDNDAIFQPTHLVGPRECDREVYIGGRVVLIQAWSLSLNTEKGHLYKGDALQWFHGTTQVGFAIGFVKAHVDNEDRYFAFVRGCTKSSEVAWVRTNEQASPLVVHASVIVGSVPYVEIDGNIVPLLHRRSV
jgi:hypothetical protein